jgi:hypothetical protein
VSSDLNILNLDNELTFVIPSRNEVINLTLETNAIDMYLREIRS